MGEWSHMYTTARWKAARLRHLAAFPLCAFCQKEGHINVGTVVDHIRPHKGDEALFWNPDNWQTLCQRHHSSDKQIIEKGGKPKQRIGIDGFPIT